VQAGGVVSGGMPLHPWQRETIERMLHCKVLNRYGCEELGTIACECTEQRGLHVQAYSKHVEVVGGDGQPLPAGETGYLIVTDFDNAAMPFIRYRIEDLGSLSERRCACGRLWPLIERLEGRESDFIRTPEGKMVSGISLTDNFGASIPGVFQLQLVQDQLDHIVVRIVRDQEFGDGSLQAIEALTREYFGPRMRHSCEFVPAIPLEASGKSRFVLSRIDPAAVSAPREETAGVSAAS
jgi:phenylacetate-CoA ligase